MLIFASLIMTVFAITNTPYRVADLNAAKMRVDPKLKETLKTFMVAHSASTYSPGCMYGFFLPSQTGIDVPIRLNYNNDIECLSTNGRDCAWGQIKSVDQCNQFLTSNYAVLNSLICGDMHLRVWGGRGYGDPNHWCQKGYDWIYNRWHCKDESGIDTGIRLDPITKNVQCLSMNGKDCVWGDFGACTRARDAGQFYQPLTCGAYHITQWGAPNPYYAVDGHWCKYGNAFFQNTQEWICAGDILSLDTPIRMNPNGDVECFSNNGRDCAWGNGTGPKCVQYIQANLNNQNPLVCGRMHLNTYGGDGYSDTNHWCRKYMDGWVLRGRQP